MRNTDTRIYVCSVLLPERFDIVFFNVLHLRHSFKRFSRAPPPSVPNGSDDFNGYQCINYSTFLYKNQRAILTNVNKTEELYDRY